VLAALGQKGHLALTTEIVCAHQSIGNNATDEPVGTRQMGIANGQ
jgi:hypothetical protein